MSSIPDSFEVLASKSNYTKLIAGKHRLRVLGPSTVGWEWWEETAEGGRKPSRLKLEENPPVSHADNVKKFMAFPVWNYDENRVQILSISQASIQKELLALDRDKDWGDLQKYDIEIERTGTDKNTTKYRVTPKPKSELLGEIQTAIVEGRLPILDALFVGADPFNFNPDATVSLESPKVDEDDFDKFVDKQKNR